MKQGSLGMKEYIAIVIFMIGVKMTEDTPATLFNTAKNAAWMIPIISASIFFIPLFLLLKTMSLFDGKNLFAVIQRLLGKYIGFFICLLIFLINSSAISFDTRTYANIIGTFYFTTTPQLVIYVLLMFVCAYGAKKGLQHIGSVAWIVLLYALVSIYLALILSLQYSNIEGIFPILGPGIPEIVKTSLLKTALFADLFILTIIIPHMNSIKEYKKGTWIAFIFVMLHLTISIMIFICFFDTSLDEVAYPFHTAIRFISFGSFLSNIETLFFPIWVLGAFIRFAAFLYINAMMFGHLFKIKDFEFLIPSLATIYLFIGMIPESPIDVVIDFKGRIQTIAGPTFATISILLWSTALLKGEFKHAKNKSNL